MSAAEQVNSSERVSEQPGRDPMGGFRTLGRLLVVGLGAGATIGGIAGGLLPWAIGDGGAYWALGAMLGVVVGLASGAGTQVVGYAVAVGVRRVRPAVGLPGMCRVLAACAVAASAGAVWAVTASPDAPLPRRLVLVALVCGLTLSTALSAGDWCLRPLERARA